MEAGDEIKSLPALQDAIKRQPQAYKSDFFLQYSALKSALERFEAQPQVSDSLMQELVMFCAQTSAYYTAPDKSQRMSQELAGELCRLLRIYNDTARDSHIKTFMSALILMDNRNFIDRGKLYTQFLDFLSLTNDLIPLMAIKQIVKHLGGGKTKISDAQKKDWQRLIFSRYEPKRADDRPNVLVRRRLQFVMISLYMRGAWQDIITCNTIAQGVFDKCPKIVLNAARFLLGEVRKLVLSEASNANEIELDDEVRRRKAAEMVASISRDLNGNNKKTTGKALKNLEKLKEIAASELQDLEGKLSANVQIQQGILRSIYDPHSFAERLFEYASRKNQNSKLSYRTRLMLLKIVSRFIGKLDVHVPGFLTFMTKYMNPTQEKATAVMAIVAEAVSEVVPIDELQAVTRHIANHFAIAASSAEAMTVGINTIREMCVRNKNAVTAELLEDLLRLGRESHDKGVNIAAKSLRTHYRLVDPMMLPRKERSRGNDLANFANKTDEAVGLIPGMDILVGMKAARAAKRSLAATKEDHVDVTEAEAMKYQTSGIMTDEELSALRKIQVKMATAQSMGLSLKQWLKANENSWAELNVLKRKKRKLEHEDAEHEGFDGKKEKAHHDKGGDGSLDGEENESVEDELDGGLDGELDGELDLDSSDNSQEIFEVDSDDDGADDDGEGDSEVEEDKGSDASSESSESTEDASDDSETDDFVQLSQLRGRVRLSKEKKRELTKRQKLEEKKLMKEKRHGGKESNRAGISNRVQARSKPMAMLRQKRKNRDKRVLSARDKVAGLKAHIKTLKTSIKQKFRRR